MNYTPISGSASFGIDVGHSSVKIAASMLSAPTVRHCATIPTVVIRASSIADENTARLAALETVTIDGINYFFGETAILQGNASVFSGQSRDWIATSAHDVMILAGWKRAMSMIDCCPQKINLVLGLPMAFFSTQKNALKARVGALLASHLVPGQELEILVRPQSIVPLINIQHTADGLPNPQYRAESQSWAVIDIGHYTTDFAILLRTQIQDIGGDSVAGASKVHSAVRAEFNALGYSVTLEAVDEAIKTGLIKHYGETIDVSAIVDAAAQPLRDLIVDRAQTLLSDSAKSLDGIIVSGGIAPMMIDAVKGAFRNAKLDETPRIAIAEGLCRFGLFAHHARAIKTK
jgi:plasmid segregation protein ParM